MILARLALLVLLVKMVQLALLALSVLLDPKGKEVNKALKGNLDRTVLMVLQANKDQLVLQAPWALQVRLVKTARMDRMEHLERLVQQAR